MRKRLLIIVASIVVIVGVIVVAYFVFARGTANLSVSNDPFAGTGSGTAGEVLPEEDTGAGAEIAPKLIRVTDHPVAFGAVVIDRISTSSTPIETASGTPAVAIATTSDAEVRFIDRASGNIYRYTAHARSLTRISNKTLPGIQRVSWLPSGATAYTQFLSGTGDSEYVATYVLPDSGEGGFFLEQNLSQAVTIGSSTLFTLLSGTTGSVGSVSKADGTGARTLFTSLLSSIVVHPTTGGYFANTKPSIQLNGYAFQINTTNGAFTRLIGPLPALSTLPSPNGKSLLYSYMDRGTLRLAVLDTGTRASTALPVATLVEKCVWTADSLVVYCGIPTSLPDNLPDDWYQGARTFQDRIWRIDMQQRVATLIIDPVSAGNVSLDAVALALDPAEDVLTFTDKSTGSLWVYDL